MLGVMRLSREQQHEEATATFDHTVAELSQPRDGAAAAALCRRLNGVVDRKIEALREEGAAVACAPRCHYCCHLRVTVFAHEAAALLAHLRTHASPDEAAEVERRIRANAERVDGMTAAQHRRAGIACAFLIDGLCSAHDVRPSACAAYHSLRRDRCADNFRRPAGVGTVENSRPVLLDLQIFAAAQIEATNAGRIAAGLPDGQTELHQALRALLDSGV